MIVLDYRDKRPIYEQVYEKLSKLIITGALEKDSKLPSVRALAMDLSVNPNTIQRAYAELEKAGYIYVVTGKGNFVSDSSAYKSEQQQAVISQLTEAINNARLSGITPQQINELIKNIYDK